MTMEKSRRRFFRDAGAAALGLGYGLPLFGTGCSFSGEGAPGDNESLNQWAMIIDIEKCLLQEVRTACVEACRLAHNIPDIPDPDEKIEWIWNEKYEHVFEDQVHERTAHSVKEAPVLVLCNHCDKPPCVRVCPTQATWKRESDGVVMMDMHRCIGCRYCMAACPYGARRFNWGKPMIAKEELNTETHYLGNRPRFKGVVEKCTFCIQRTRGNPGQYPACVEICPVGARKFGNLLDPNSEIMYTIRNKRVFRLKEDLNTNPQFYYFFAT